MILLAAASFPAAARALTLEEAVAKALERNEVARAADEDAKAASATAKRARAFLLPTITATGEYRLSGSKGESPFLDGSDRRTATARVEQTLFDARAWPLLRQAVKGSDAVRWGAADTKRRLAFQTAESFLAALSADEVARAAAERMDFANRNLSEVKLRFEGGLVGSNDVTRAELEAATAEREVVRASGAAQNSILFLANLLHEEVTDSLALPDSLLSRAARPVAPGSLDVEAAGKRRPDLVAERARVASLRAGAWEPLFRYLPRISAFGTTRAIDGTRPSGSDGDWSVGLSGTWDIFDGGNRESERAARAATARSASLGLQNLERRVALDVESARVTLESEQASVVRAFVAVEAARRNATETNELYRRGLARALEVTDANVQLFEAEVERARAQFSLALAYLNLRSALGWGPLDLPSDAETSR
ncbi:MAG TPA: TolC family protein [Candidatus Eisenbacteria bacterium]|nr:TolC family protein [Candidatus Eisenbacteria bacterium]